MDQLDLSVFAEKYNLIALVDQDPGSASVRRRFAKRCREASIPVHQLNRYAIENCFSIRALRKVLGAQMPGEITEVKPDVKLEDQIGINVKRDNRKIAQEMTLDEIQSSDLAAFFQKVEKLVAAGSTKH